MARRTSNSTGRVALLIGEGRVDEGGLSCCACRCLVGEAAPHCHPTSHRTSWDVLQGPRIQTWLLHVLQVNQMPCGMSLSTTAADRGWAWFKRIKLQQDLPSLDKTEFLTSSQGRPRHECEAPIISAHEPSPLIHRIKRIVLQPGHLYTGSSNSSNRRHQAQVAAASRAVQSNAANHFHCFYLQAWQLLWLLLANPAPVAHTLSFWLKRQTTPSTYATASDRWRVYHAASRAYSAFSKTITLTRPIWQ